MHTSFLNDQCQKKLPGKVRQEDQAAKQAADHRERKGRLTRKSKDGRNDGRT